MTLGAVAQGSGAFLVQRDKLEGLGVYLTEVSAWMAAATACLTVGARLPRADPFATPRP